MSHKFQSSCSVDLMHVGVRTNYTEQAHWEANTQEILFL